jgi:hypothetical protein
MRDIRNRKTDTSGRPYAELSKLRAGDLVELDDGFDCAPPGKVMLHFGKGRRLYFICSHGQHFVDGQADDGVHCVGMYGDGRPR